MAYGQPANNITGDEIDEPEPSIWRKINRRQHPLSELAAQARERRKRIKEIITDINDSSDQRSNSAEPANPLPGAVDQLSHPAFECKLPFPFVGSKAPVRFTLVEGNWQYVGRTKFKELLQELKKVQESDNYSTVWLYGTQGYGKSHLLAALVCYLAAQDERVVYIPDCRSWLLDPIGYVQAAMLFAWADGINTQNKIITLETEHEIEAFLKKSDAIFVVDQMNALKTSNNPIEGNKRSDLSSWLGRFTSRRKSVYSSSANDTNFHEASIKQNMNFVLPVYGGFSKVSHLKIYVAMRLLT